MSNTEFLARRLGNNVMARAFLIALVVEDMAFNLEDDPADIVDLNTNEPLFNKTEAQQMRDRIREINEHYTPDDENASPNGFLLRVIETLGD